MKKLTQTFEEIIDDVQTKYQAEGIVIDRLIDAVKEYNKETVEELQKLADYQMKQKAIRMPEYIKGINKAGKALNDKLIEIRQRQEKNL